MNRRLSSAKSLVKRCVSSCAAVVFAVAILALTLSAAPLQADSRIFACPQQGTADFAAADTLLQQPWDTVGLACGAQVYLEAADKNPGDPAAQLAALRANEHYMYYLDKIILYELGYLINWYVDDVPEEKKLNAPMRAMINAQQAQQGIVQRLRMAKYPSAELDYFEAQTLGVSAQAQPLLSKAVAADPPQLAGAAHAQLAETYYTLPDILGGDLEKAVAMMQAAQKRAAENPRYLRILSGYQLELYQSDQARATLSSLLRLGPEKPELQLFADQLRSAAELAIRMGESGLASELGATREKILAQHPYLQKRKVVSAMGHFGSNNPLDSDH